jgi:hypothetical protein
MSNTELAKRLTDTLKSTRSPKLFNPWRDKSFAPTLRS